MLPYAKNEVTESDISAVVECMRTGWLARGKLVPKLEARLAEIAGTDFCVVFNNGTNALHAALLAFDAKQVISPTVTFNAIANAAHFAGARLALTDVLEDTLTADWNKIVGQSFDIDDQPTVIVPMDYAGYPSHATHGNRPPSAFVLRDAAHSFGATFLNEPVMRMGDMSVASFHPAKAVTSGEGGAVFTDNDYYHHALKCIRDNGRMNGLHHDPGLNYHMPEMAAALLLSQLDRLEAYLTRRRVIAARYREAWMKDLRINLLAHDTGHAYHLFVVRLEKSVKIARDGFRAELEKRGVGSQIHYRPMHLMPFCRPNFDPDAFPVANNAWETMLSLPMYPTLTDEEVEHVVRSVNEVLDCHS